MLGRIHAHWLDPVTRKRFKRFRARRRAWISLWALLCLYAVSLAAELVCNDRPLYLRFNGRSHFPAFRFYPEDVFLANGRKTRTDYLKLVSSGEFRADPRRLVIWAPVRCGPNTSIDPESLRGSETVTLELSQVRRAGSVNVDRDLRVVSAVGAGAFFGTNDGSVAGLPLSGHWALDGALSAAVEARFANRPDERRVSLLAPLSGAGATAEVSLPEYASRAAAPRTVRLTFREADRGGETGRWGMSFTPAGEPAGKPRAGWQALPPDTRAGIAGRVPAAFEAGALAFDVSAAGALWRAELRRRSASWPHPPTGGHWFGIDSAGRDVFARILYGMRISLTFGLLLVAATMLLGSLAGAAQGFYGGMADMAGQRIIEVWSAMPFLYIMILMGSVFGRSFALLLACYAAFNWIGISYYMRAEFLRLRHQQFVDAARCLGIPDRRIIARHIMPNALTPLITFFPFYLVGAIGSLAALDYLGFGLPPPTPSWGELLSQAQQFRWAWWLILYPSLALFAVMVLGVFIGEGVRDAFDPRPFTRMESA